jgi:hypothetical protein
MPIEARVVLEKLPPQPPAKQALKPRYADKAALLADLQAIRPPYAVRLDGRIIWQGVGPAAPYRTGDDGSVSR